MKSALLVLPLIAGVMWGAAGIFVRTLSGSGMSDITIVFTRVLFGVIVMALIIASSGKDFRVSRKDIPLMIICGLSMTAVNFTYTIAANNVSLSLAAVLLSLAPVFMLIMARVAFGERFTSKKMVGMCAAVVGCLLVSGFLEEDQTLSTVGVLAGVMSGFFYAFYGIVTKKASAEGYTVYKVLFYCMLVSCIVLFPVSDLGSVVSFGSDNWWGWPFMFVHAMVATVLPFLLYNIAIARTEAGAVAILAACGEPMSAAVFGLLVFDEVPTALMLVGMAVVLVSIVVMCSQHKPHARKHVQ